jgi:ketosteroid isomerase-like protein
MDTKMVIKIIFYLIFPVCLFSILLSCKNSKTDTEKERKEINTMLDSWNAAAAKADFNAYFNYLNDDAIFIGTDATENWDKKSYMIWAKPFFDRGKTWDFKSIERHIFFDKSGKTAWFDELLNTQMKICRGSGVVIKIDNKWKIQQYVLSMTIPNEKTDTIISLKASDEDIIINKLLEKQ